MILVVRIMVKDVGMVQKGQKLEGMLCGEILAVSGLHVQGYVLSFFTVPTSLAIFVETFCSFPCICHASESG